MRSATTEVRSRRALLTGAAVGVAAAMVARPQEASADTGDALVLGGINESGSSTRIYRPQFDSNFTSGVELNAGDFALHTQSRVDGGIGVSGLATGSNSVGVRGATTGLSSTGVRGETDGHHTMIGVSGISDSEGIGVKGVSPNGTGVWAQANGGHALRVIGRAVFSRSGRTAFNQGQASKTISNQFVGDGGIVLATIQGNVAGTYVRGVSLDVQHNRFTIRLNKRAPKRVVVGWFIVN